MSLNLNLKIQCANLALDSKIKPFFIVIVHKFAIFFSNSGH
jgi:hypothetical protein